MADDQYISNMNGYKDPFSAGLHGEDSSGCRDSNSYSMFVYGQQSQSWFLPSDTSSSSSSSSTITTPTTGYLGGYTGGGTRSNAAPVPLGPPVFEKTVTFQDMYDGGQRDGLLGAVDIYTRGVYKMRLTSVQKQQIDVSSAQLNKKGELQKTKIVSLSPIVNESNVANRTLVAVAAPDGTISAHKVRESVIEIIDLCRYTGVAKEDPAIEKAIMFRLRGEKAKESSQTSFGYPATALLSFIPEAEAHPPQIVKTVRPSDTNNARMDIFSAKHHALWLTSPKNETQCVENTTGHNQYCKIVDMRPVLTIDGKTAFTQLRVKRRKTSLDVYENHRIKETPEEISQIYALAKREHLAPAIGEPIETARLFRWSCFALRKLARFALSSRPALANSFQSKISNATEGRWYTRAVLTAAASVAVAVLMQTPAAQKAYLSFRQPTPVSFHQLASKPAIVQPSFTPQTTLQQVRADSPKASIASGLFDETPLYSYPSNNEAAWYRLPKTALASKILEVNDQWFFVTVVTQQPNAQYKGSGFVKKSDLHGPGKPSGKMNPREIDRQKQSFIILNK